MHEKQKAQIALKIQAVQEAAEREAEAMTEKGKEARRAYKREWARRNPEKIREQQQRYWNKRGESGEMTDHVKVRPENNGQIQ